MYLHLCDVSLATQKIIKKVSPTGFITPSERFKEALQEAVRLYCV